MERHDDLQRLPYEAEVGSKVNVSIVIVNAERITGVQQRSTPATKITVLGVDAGDFGIPVASVDNDERYIQAAVPLAETIGKSNATSALLLFGYFYFQPWLPPTLDAAGKIVYNPLLEARTQLLTSMILMELANAISARSLRYPVWKVGAFKNKFLWYAVALSFILQLFVLYTPGVNSVFDVAAPEPLDWAFAILFTAVTFGSLETAKWITSRRHKKQV